MNKDRIVNNNQKVMELRSKHSEHNDYGISELIRMPKLYDWVDCRVDSDNTFLMFLAGADDGVALKFFWNGKYESYSIKLWTKLSNDGNKIRIDVGAHTGAYTLAALNSGHGKVLSFEPHFANYSRMLINLKANGFETKNAFMYAVGEKIEEVNFYLPTSIDYLSTGGSIKEQSNSIKFPVKSVSLNRFIKEEYHANVSAIKIDVEGFEIQVLKGAEKIIEKSKPIIFFECISDQTGKEVQNFLESKGYKFWMIDDDSNVHSPVKEIKSERDSSGKIIMTKLNRIASTFEI
jgi:FkbM family methyltransferase